MGSLIKQFDIDENKYAALDIACRTGNITIVNSIIESGINELELTSNILEAAVAGNNDNIVQTILKIGNFEFDQHILNSAISNNNLKMVDILINQYKDKITNKVIGNELSYYEGSVEILNLLLDASPNPKGLKIYIGKAMSNATDTDVIILLFNFWKDHIGGELDSKTLNLIIVNLCRCSNLDTFIFVMENIIDISVIDFNRLLLKGIRNEKCDFISIILKYLEDPFEGIEAFNIEIDEIDENKLMTLFHAILDYKGIIPSIFKHPSFDVFKCFVDSGIDFKEHYHSGLLSSCVNGSWLTTEYLLNNYQYTKSEIDLGFLFSIVANNTPVTMFIMNYDINSKFGLQIACKMGHCDVIKILLEKFPQTQEFYHQMFDTAINSGQMYVSDYIFKRIDPTPDECSRVLAEYGRIGHYDINLINKLCDPAVLEFAFALYLRQQGADIDYTEVIIGLKEKILQNPNLLWNKVFDVENITDSDSLILLSEAGAILKSIDTCNSTWKRLIMSGALIEFSSIENLTYYIEWNKLNCTRYARIYT